jgi:hypothetical protein
MARRKSPGRREQRLFQRLGTKQRREARAKMRVIAASLYSKGEINRETFRKMDPPRLRVFKYGQL